jgi:uncharacterized paraquat-inducible protein A
MPTALISLLALLLIFSVAGVLLGGVVSFWTEPSRRLRFGFYALLAVGITIASWATFFFHVEPRRRLRIVGIPFPVHVFELQNHAWNEIDWTSHRRFGIGVNFVTMTGLISAPVSIAMMVRAHRRQRSQQRLRDGHCPTCNYDLRHSPEQCPECGRAGQSGGSGFGERTKA